MFSTHPETNFNFSIAVNMSSAIALNLDQSEIVLFGRVNSLPNNKILDWFKLKALADDKRNMTEELKFVLGRVENIVGIGENAGYQHFLLFPKCYQKASSSRVVKSWECLVKS